MLKDFLTVPLPVEDLAAALRVIEAFKRQESQQEWLMARLSTWYMLERLEAFLRTRVEGVPLEQTWVPDWVH